MTEDRRLAASIRFADHPDDDRMHWAILHLRERLQRWERQGWTLGKITVERTDDPATGEVRLLAHATATLTGRPTEVDEQVRQDTTGPLRGTAWAMTLSGEVITVPPPYGLPTGPPGETWVRR